MNHLPQTAGSPLEGEGEGGAQGWIFKDGGRWLKGPQRRIYLTPDNQVRSPHVRALDGAYNFLPLLSISLFVRE